MRDAVKEEAARVLRISADYVNVAIDKDGVWTITDTKNNDEYACNPAISMINLVVADKQTVKEAVLGNNSSPASLQKLVDEQGDKVSYNYEIETLGQQTLNNGSKGEVHKITVTQPVALGKNETIYGFFAGDEGGTDKTLGEAYDPNGDLGIEKFAVIAFYDESADDVHFLIVSDKTNPETVRTMTLGGVTYNYQISINWN